MKEYEVWTEGYAATGERAGAMLHGKIKANTFDEACIKILGNSLDTDKTKSDGYRRGRTGNLCVWACNCFDNEKDGRKSFG